MMQRRWSFGKMTMRLAAIRLCHHVPIFWLLRNLSWNKTGRPGARTRGGTADVF